MPPSYSRMLPGRMSTPLIFMGLPAGKSEERPQTPECRALYRPAPPRASSRSAGRGDGPSGAAIDLARTWTSPNPNPAAARSEEHTSELQSLMRISYAVFCLKKKKQLKQNYAKSEQPKK